MGCAYGSWHSINSTNSSAKGASTRSASEKSTKHTNRLLQHQHDVHQHEKKKTKYKKYQARITALSYLIKTNIKEYFVSAHKNSSTRFCLVNPIALIDYIQTNYEPSLPKNTIERDCIGCKRYPTTPIAVLFTCIEDCKLFAKAGEEPFTNKKILCSV